MKNINKQLQGILWMLVHCCMITLIVAFARQLSDKFGVFQIMFSYCFVAFIFMAIWLFIKKHKLKINYKTKWMYAFRAFLGLVAMGIFFTALKEMSYVKANAITLACPLVTTTMAALFLKEKMGVHRIFALIIGFCGALVVVRPGIIEVSPAVFLVVVSILIWGVCDILIKIMSKDDTFSQVFVMTMVTTAICFPIALYHWVAPDLYDILVFVIMGALFTINMVSLVLSFRNGDVSVIMPFTFSVVLFSAFWGYLMFGEVVDFWTIVGSLIIVASSTYIAYREKKANIKHPVDPESLHV